MSNPYFDKLDELGMTFGLKDASGSTWTAGLGSHNGTIVGASISSPGSHGFPPNLGSVLTFNGSSNYVDLGNSPAFAPSGNIAMAFWIQLLGPGDSGWDQYMGKNESYRVRRIGAQQFDNNMRFTFKINGNDFNADAYPPANSLFSSIRLVVCSYNESQRRIMSSDDNGQMVMRASTGGPGGAIQADSASKLILMACDNAGTIYRHAHGRMAAPSLSITSGMSLEQAQALYDAAFEDPPTPDAPDGWSFTKVPGQAALVGSWEPVPGVDSYDYEVEHFTDPSWVPHAQGNTQETTFTVSEGLVVGDWYRGRVKGSGE